MKAWLLPIKILWSVVLVMNVTVLLLSLMIHTNASTLASVLAVCVGFSLIALALIWVVREKQSLLATRPQQEREQDC